MCSISAKQPEKCGRNKKVETVKMKKLLTSTILQSFGWIVANPPYITETPPKGQPPLQKRKFSEPPLEGVFGGWIPPPRCRGGDASM